MLEAPSKNSYLTKKEIAAALAFYTTALSGFAYFTYWALANNAGSLNVTVGNMDNCPAGSGASFSDGSGNPQNTISCPALATMNPQGMWPEFPVDGCIDGDNYQRSVASLLANRCTPDLIKNCASLLANAFFSGSRETPYSKFGEYVNAYGVFCEKDTSAWIAIAFIVASALTLGMVGHGAVLIHRLWKREDSSTTTPQAANPLLNNDNSKPGYSAV